MHHRTEALTRLRSTKKNSERTSHDNASRGVTGFSVRREKIDMEDVMNTPLRGKLQSIVDRGHHLDNLKGAMPLGRKLGGWLIRSQVMSLKPHEISFLVLGRISVFDP